ncbi:MAG: hypothetical protein IPO60_12230 [Flavobacteriales bacterium]|nr:hypothetical protein [Flavobacteriales bacterium]
MNSSQLYRTGTYGMEVLTLPRLYIPGVVIKQSSVTPVSIPKSGVLNVVIAWRAGAIFQKEGNELKWVVNAGHTGLRATNSNCYPATTA